MISETSLASDSILRSGDNPLAGLSFKRELAFGLLYTAMREDERRELCNILNKLPQTAATCLLAEEDAFRPLLETVSEKLVHQQRRLTDNDPSLYTIHTENSRSALAILAAIAQRAHINCRIETQADVCLRVSDEASLQALANICAQPDGIARVAFQVSNADDPEVSRVLAALPSGTQVIRWPALVVVESPNLLNLRDQLSLD